MPLFDKLRTGFRWRLWKEVDSTRTSFFYADEGLVAEYDNTGTELASYGYKPDSTWTTDPLWQKRDGEYYFYQNDHLGTPQKLVKQNGAVVWSASYTAFGQATLEVEEMMNNLRFPGQYADAETGLYYNYFRHYDPMLGRYSRTDPIGLKKLANHHLFIYVNNNPLINIDTAGLMTQSCIRKMSPSQVLNNESGHFFYCNWLNQLAHNLAKWGEGENHTIGTNPPCLLCWKVRCPAGYSLHGKPRHKDICLEAKNHSPWPTIGLSTLGEPVKGWQTRDPNIYVPLYDVDYCVAVTTRTNWSNSKLVILGCVRLTYTCCPDECNEELP